MQPIAGTITADTHPGAYSGQDAYNDRLIPVAFDCKSSGQNGFGAGEISPTLRAMGAAASHANAGGQLAVAFEARYARNGRGAPSDLVPPLKAQSGETGKGDGAPLVAIPPPVAFKIRGGCEGGGKGYLGQDDAAFTLSTVQEQNLLDAMRVRRLTPTECERLMGFPDGWTNITYNGKPAADGPRYKACGNSMIVKKMQHVLERIEKVNQLKEGII